MYPIGSGTVLRFNPRLVRGLKLLLISGAVFSVFFALFVFKPKDGGLYPPCPFHELTGLYCPGCGSLRAVHLLLHGNFAAAFGLNPLLVLSLPFLGYCLISSRVRSPSKRSRAGFIPAFWIWFILSVIILFWILRNLPFYPLTLLAP
ncbi:MAG: DUF2752 domain-containing protein [Sedimentisphaerales bacterium]|nr:DUF2752 domain-containing protein [Sedimentisphaerales bacterium]